MAMQQPSAQGIASLYRGNPQPLQQVIQKEQQAKPGLPPDLQKLLALQIVNNEKDSVAAQQAMQQLQQMGGGQGQPPTVMQSLQQQAQQKMQAQAMQAQRQQQGLQALAQRAPNGPVPEGTPQPEAQPEAQGIDQLPAEFGMAGGGIVAFAGGGATDIVREVLKELGESAGAYVNDPAVKQTVDKIVQERMGPTAQAAAPAAQAAAQPASRGYTAAKSLGAGRLGSVARNTPAGIAAGEVLENMGSYKFQEPGLDTSVSGVTGALGRGEFKQAGKNLAMGLPETAMDIGRSVAGVGDYLLPGQPLTEGMDRGLKALLGNKLRTPSDAAQVAAKAEASPDNQSAAETARLMRQKTLPQAPASAPPPAPGGQNTAPRNTPRPAAAPGAAPGAGSAPRETMDPMEKAIRDSIMSTMGRKEGDEYQQGVERFQKTTGLDALYKEMGDRATAREARNAESQKQRTPAWVKGLSSLGGAPVRGGLGMLLAKAGAGAGEAREGYAAADAKFANEVDTLRDAITKAKMEGNMKGAAAGEQALKDLVASKRYAEQSGTSLLNTQEQVRGRLQAAKDSAASRAQVAQARQDQLAQAGDMKKLAAAESAFEKDPEVKILTKRFEDPLFAQSAEGRVALARIRQIQADKYRQAGVDMVSASDKNAGFTAAPTSNVRAPLK